MTDILKMFVFVALTTVLILFMSLGLPAMLNIDDTFLNILGVFMAIAAMFGWVIGIYYLLVHDA